MSIAQIVQSRPGWEGTQPRIVQILTDDSFATITTAGWLSEAQKEGLYSPLPSDLLLVSYNSFTSPIVGTFTITISGGVVTLNPASGDVILPVVSGDFANFTGTSGNITDLGYSPSNAAKTKVVMANAATVANHIMVSTDTAGTSGNLTGTAQNDGSLQAGRSGVAGNLIAYPAGALAGRIVVSAIGNTGDFTITISNAIFGQASVLSIQDVGAASANFIMSALAGAGIQHITTGSLSVDTGNLIAGSANNAGTVASFPPTTGNGELILAAVNAGGAFNTTISNGVMGQSSVYTIPDVVNAAGRFLVGATAAPFTSGNFPVASGTGGLMIDSGLPAANIQNKTNIKAARTADIGGAGAGPISVVVAGVTAASIITGTINASSNPVSIAKITATGTGFDILFTGDPGASAIVDYVAFVVAQ